MEPQIYKDDISVFYGGMSEDMRIQKAEVFRLASHVDIWTNPKRMTPYRSMVPDQNDADAAKAYSIVMFERSNLLYGLGISSGAIAKIYNKVSDPILGDWTASTSGADGGGSRAQFTFRAFHNYIYGGATGRIWAYGDTSGSPSFTATAYNGAGIPTGQAIVTSDDLLLVPCGNKVAKKNGAGSGPTDGWTIGITVPDQFIITDLTEFGDIVALALAPASGIGESKVFLWDKISQDPQSVINWGEGNLKILDNLEGQLVGVSSISGSTFSIRPKMVFKIWEGGSKAQQKFELQADRNTTLIVYGNHCKFIDGIKLVFGVKITLEGVAYNQLFAVGRKSTGYPLSYSFERRMNNDTDISNNIQGLLKLDNYVFVAYNQDGSINRTNDQEDYTGATGVYITQKINGQRQAGIDAARKRKQVMMAGLTFVPLTSGQSVALYMRKDSTTSWKLIRTYSTVGELSFEAGIFADDSDFGSCKEWQFKGVEIGGAEITGFPYAFKVLDADVAP